MPGTTAATPSQSLGTLVGIGCAYFLGRRWRIADDCRPRRRLFIFKIAFDLIRSGLDELMEHSLPAETEAEILRIITADPAIREPHNLRTRRIGASIAIEVHVRVDGEMTVRHSHELTVDIERRLRERFGAGTMIAARRTGQITGRTAKSRHGICNAHPKKALQGCRSRKNLDFQRKVFTLRMQKSPNPSTRGFEPKARLETKRIAYRRKILLLVTLKGEKSMNVQVLSDRVLLNNYLSGDRSAISSLIERHSRRVRLHPHDGQGSRHRGRYFPGDLHQGAVRVIDEGRYSDNGKFLVVDSAHRPQPGDRLFPRPAPEQVGKSRADAGYDMLGTLRFAGTDGRGFDGQRPDRTRRAGTGRSAAAEQREVVMLRYFSGLSFKDIAEQTDVSINTALGRMRYALIQPAANDQRKKSGPELIPVIQYSSGYSVICKEKADKVELSLWRIWTKRSFKQRHLRGRRSDHAGR